jgi:hypothetical protein
MAKENDKSTFSIRIDTGLRDQIDKRAALAKRSRNAEIEVLLETAIDLHVQRDKKLLEVHQQLSEQITG